jgi:hypothetical protein
MECRCVEVMGTTISTDVLLFLFSIYFDESLCVMAGGRHGNGCLGMEPRKLSSLCLQHDSSLRWHGCVAYWRVA